MGASPKHTSTSSPKFIPRAFWRLFRSGANGSPENSPGTALVCGPWVPCYVPISRPGRPAILEGTVRHGRTTAKRDHTTEGDDADILTDHMGRAVAHRQTARPGMKAVEIHLRLVGAVDEADRCRPRCRGCSAGKSRAEQLAVGVVETAPASAGVSGRCGEPRRIDRHQVPALTGAARNFLHAPLPEVGPAGEFPTEDGRRGAVGDHVERRG